MTVTFTVSQWSGWSPATLEDHTGAAPVSHAPSPDVAAIPPMLRRRLNLLGRACAGQILQHLEDGDNLPIVYCSRHGDIERTLGVLSELAADEPVSPMHFSLAVHNAICGVISIHRKLTANISTIAASDGLVPVLLEAAGLLSDTSPRVLCVLGDTHLPAPYRSDVEGDEPFAASFMVTTTGGQALALAPDSRGSEGTSSPLAFVAFLSSSRREMALRHNGLSWRLRKNG